ncbi:MAG: peptide chain release factor N(5)-glutamine methyltransferase [Thermomicrobiales bacterium]|nr:peptide chain release factor N(5)-glutamine methyltransferase [Thermomicrobiales bacterium]
MPAGDAREPGDASTARERPATNVSALRAGRAALERAQVEAPGLDAEVLLRHLLGVDRAALFARLQESLAPSVHAAYRDLIEARAGGKPVAYLIGEREFMGLDFAVRPGVLIPRPETEILVEWAIAWLRDRPGARVVDVGTGSGAIALSLVAILGPAWQGFLLGVDISPDAIEIAETNRARLGLEERVTFVRASLLSWLEGPIDLILANLPYLRPEQIASNPELAAEPALALAGGPDGLEVIERLIRDAPRVLAPGGAVGLEIDPGQRDAVLGLARIAFPEAEMRVLPDLAGLDRHVVIQTPRSG